ncbi:nuclear pore complex protein Nup50 [Leptinotarsa decemlineata]|uniref:nuclear pore complex protein Nup50 n=1 Tax=Leptinotarsa decemlineata TaxID=7539 RepID=UPI003D30727D
MAGKRRASSELNYDKDDDEAYEQEEAGTFQKASEESLKKRVFKTAKRRNPISSVRDNGESGSKSAFTGLMFSNATPPTSTSFSFLSNLAAPKTNGFSESTKKSVPDTQEKFSVPTSTTNTTSFGHTKSTNAPNDNSIPKSTDKKSEIYYSKLKGLNESVSNWIKKHVDANPLINLQPIFKDYEQYFKELELETNSTSADENELTVVDTEKEKQVSSMSNFVFKALQNVPDSTTEKTNSDTQKKNAEEQIPKFSFVSPPVTNPSTQQGYTEVQIPKFSFGSSSVTNPSAASKPTFGFGNMSTTKTFSLGTPNASTSTTPASISSSFSFGSKYPSTMSTFSSSTPFTFANVTKPPATQESSADADDNYEPPKNDFKPVTETDYIYTIRCKVFVKKDDKFGDRGVGNLYLKSIEGSEKVQLIVRADTNLGNLLCNFILSESIPTKRMGNKDVMLICLPTPEFKPPPVPILLRVKTSEEADKLLEVLEKHKK